MKNIFVKIFFTAITGFITVLLLIIGFFAKETFITIKSLEKDISTIRVKLAEIEAERISRDKIEKIIKDYHDYHPCVIGREK
jgi:hypothetical protein